MQDGAVLPPPMERATRSPQSRQRKRRLLEAMQHVSLPSERLLVERLAAQVAVTQIADQGEAVNTCVRVLRNVKNSVYLRALAARALGLLMMESRTLADRLRLETEGLVDALLQLVGYFRRSHTQTADTRRAHVNCCLVISLLMQAPSQQQRLQLVVSVDSDLLVLQPQPSERDSASLLLTVAGRPESGDTTRPVDDDDCDVFTGTDSIESFSDRKKTKKKRRQTGSEPPSPSRAARSTNRQSPPRQQHRKIAWSEHDASVANAHDASVANAQGLVVPQSPFAALLPGTSNGSRTTETLAANVARRKTPNRIFKLERHRLVTPVFPRQYISDPPLCPLPLIQPTGQRMPGGDVIREQSDPEVETQEATAPHSHPASDTLLHPRHMLEIFRTGRMPLASTAYFQQHLRDGHIREKGERQSVPSRLQVTRWDEWKKEHQPDEEESERDAMTAVATMPRGFALPETTAHNRDTGTKRQTAAPEWPRHELEPTTPALKRQRLRDILRSPVEPDEQSVQQLRALAQRVNTSAMTSLDSQITRVRHEENRTRQEMHSMIENERERLPLKFLFQLPGGASYCRHRMRRAMALWVLEFEDNQRRLALLQWKALVEQARFLERGEEYHHQATKRRLKVAIEYVLRSYQQQGLRKWIETTQDLIWRDRDTAARLIQVEIRRHLSRERFVALHRRHPFANPVLRDVYLAPARPALVFHLPNEVRAHRRQLWQAAELVQRSYRCRRFHIALARYRLAAIQIQAFQRMRAARARYHRERIRLIHVQACARMRVCRDAFVALRDAALLVQAVFRTVRMRRLRRLVRCAQRKANERVLSAVALLQRVARGWLGRLTTRQLGLVRDQEWHAALIFQRCWYRRNNEWSTFFLLGCLREKENEERAFDAQVLAYKRRHMARVISGAWLVYLAAKRSKAAEFIQRNVRRHAAQRLVELLRRQQMAHRRIKWFFRVHHAQRIRTAWYLQFWWLKAVPGRLRHHLAGRRITEELEERRRRFELEDKASCRIQALIRGHMGRTLALRERSARSIQHTVRAHLIRKHFREEMACIRALVSLQSVDKCISTARHHVVEATLKLYNASACAIQRLFRGCHCRMRLMRDLVYVELRTRMAVRIQLNWRHNAHQRAARKLLQAQRRRQTNPFRTETSWRVVIDKMVSASAGFYDPDDELRGMSVQEWLYRLGLGATYSEMCHKNRWLASVDPVDVLTRLRELERDACEEKLASIGIHDPEEMQMMLTNLFAYQTLQDTKRQRRALVLAREKQQALKRARDIAQKYLQRCIDAQQKSEDTLEEILEEAKEFRHPPKAVNDRQTASIRELEDTVRKTTEARDKYELSVARQAAHARELATQQQQFASRQEPMEISAVHSLHNLRLVGQLNVARELFLERFPGLDARALAFVGALEENQITRWQLQRFFDAYTTVSEVKQNLKELTFFLFETEVKRHDHARFGQCADILQYGHERLAELLGISMEIIVLGVEHGNAPVDGQNTKKKPVLLKQTLLDTIAASRIARGNQEKARRWRVGADVIAQMNATATKVQSLWRRRAGNRLVAGLRVNRRHQQLRERYLADFHADHVTPFWQSERKKEQEAADAWLAEEAKAHRVKLLYSTLRHPYVQEWDDEAQTYVYVTYLHQRDDSTAIPVEQAQTRHVVVEKPTYSIEEEDMTIRIQAHARRFLAQRHLHELQRLQRRGLQRAALEAEWENTRQERAQLLTLNLEFRFRNNSHVNTWLGARVKSKSSGHPKATESSPTRRGNSIKQLLDPPTADRTKSPTKGANGPQKGDTGKSTEAQEQHRVRVHATLDAAVDALARTYHASVRAEHRCNWSFPVHSRPDNAHGRAIVRLLEQLPAFYRQTAPELQPASRLRYTMMSLRFGWEQVPSKTPPRSYFFNKNTLETSWDRPDYSFDEQFAAIRIQSLGRMLVAINTRESKLETISLVTVVRDTIQRAARVGWVGYSLEGMTSAVFLSRFGLTKYVTSSLGKLPLQELLTTVSSEQQAKTLGWSKEEAALVPLFPQIRSRRSPQSCMRETSVPTSTKHPFNILPTERVISQLVTQSYPNQQGRVVGLLRALRSSTTPISYRQLQMHLRRYAGRPDDAIANVGEVASLAIATCESQEKDIFDLYRRCAERCVVYAANLRLTTLQRELSAVLRMPQRLIAAPTSSFSPVGASPSRVDTEESMASTSATIVAIPVVPISPHVEERYLQQALSRYPLGIVKGLWENDAKTSFSYAQMALYLREEALERVLAWERTALVCQTLFRMLRVRRWYIATQKARAGAATIIQCAWRSWGAREVRALLESQQQSPYEQRLDKRTSTFFIVYTPTDEKLLEEPRDEVSGGILPFRPMIQDRVTKRWMLAWPHYLPASRRARTANTGPVTEAPWVACSLCAVERAARRCNECYSVAGDYVDFCLACFYDRHFPTTAAASSDDLSWHTYMVLNPLHTQFFRCVECSRPSILRCLPCNEHYCDRCFTRVHARGKTRSRHAREWYATHASPCVECEMRVANQRCLTCQDALCESCMARTHARGRRADGKTHTMELLAQPLEPGDVYCEQCHARRGDERCEFCAQTLCAVCHWSSSSSTGVQSSRHALVCVETALTEKRRELLGDRGLCVECGKAADRECATCNDRYCSVRWMGNPGCFERFHSKGKRSDHTFTMVHVPTEMPHEILALEEQVRAKRRRDAEIAEHEAKRLAAALLEEEGAVTSKRTSKKTQQKKTKQSKNNKADTPDGRKRCAVLHCRRRALVLDVPGVSFCSEHFTLQHALEVAGKDPLEAARLLALVETGAGHVVKSQKTGWRGLLPSHFFSHKHNESKEALKVKKTSTSVQVDSSATTTT